MQFKLAKSMRENSPDRSMKDTPNGISGEQGREGNVQMAEEADLTLTAQTPPPSSPNPSTVSPQLRRTHLLCQSGSGNVALSFSGCGFLGTYHMGSLRCFLKHGRGFLGRVGRVAGTSAGSLVAAVLVLSPQSVDKSLQTFYSLADELISLKFGALTPGFSLIRRLEDLAGDFLPEDCQTLANERLFVSVTKMSDRSNSLVSNFSDRQNILKHLLASCYIPVYAGVSESPPVIDEEEFADGGLSDNLPKFSDIRTVTISPFSGEAEISPYDETKTSVFDWTMKLANQTMKVNLKNVVRGAQALFPPTREVLEQYHDLGYRDTMKFLIKEKEFEREDGSEV